MIPKNNYKTWKRRDDQILLNLIGEGKTDSEIAALMERTLRSIASRIGVLRMAGLISADRRKAKEAVEIAQTPQPLPDQTPEPLVSNDLNMLLWFIQEAWSAGLTITIVELGAVFKKPGD